MMESKNKYFFLIFGLTFSHSHRSILKTEAWKKLNY